MTAWLRVIRCDEVLTTNSQTGDTLGRLDAVQQLDVDDFPAAIVPADTQNLAPDDGWDGEDCRC